MVKAVPHRQCNNKEVSQRLLFCDLALRPGVGHMDVLYSWPLWHGGGGAGRP